MKKAVELILEVKKNGDEVMVTAKIHNKGTGHFLPTGSPMRNMLLTITATKSDGTLLKQLSGESNPDWAGNSGGLAGSPGKGFAKLFVSRRGYPSGKTSARFHSIYPEPYWRPANMMKDTRIPSGATDISEYGFSLPKEGKVSIKAKLLIRKTFATWIEGKFPEKFEYILAEKEVKL
ncbi:MAG: hypothetical protein HQK84_09610 [Nitrospinae bacterium]|nr:hypothetical protein [Nitrospinota bacterium]